MLEITSATKSYVCDNITFAFRVHNISRFFLINSLKQKLIPLKVPSLKSLSPIYFVKFDFRIF